MNTQESVLTKRQVRKFGPKYWRPGEVIKAEVRFDDECGNGHNTFSITGEILSTDRRKIDPFLAGGMLHEEIAEAFPELAPFLKWHLCSTDGPMHYPGNALYLAGERDCWGTLKGEVQSWRKSIRWHSFPITWTGPESFISWLGERTPEVLGDLEILPIEHGPDAHGYKFKPKWTFGGFAEKWHECPFDSEQEAVEFQQALRLGFEIVKTPASYGEGKERELDSARHCAVWPEATDEELCLPTEELKAKLEARLPALMAEFRAAVESLGFVW